eukprot:729222-Pyramimonas_sp.AAC.1
MLLPSLILERPPADRRASGEGSLRSRPSFPRRVRRCAGPRSRTSWRGLGRPTASTPSRSCSSRNTASAFSMTRQAPCSSSQPVTSSRSGGTTLSTMKCAWASAGAT